MKWEKASAIAEIVSSVAVLVTLVYLAIQTKELATQTEVNSAAIIASSRQGALNADMQLLRMQADYPEAHFSVQPADPDKLRSYLAALMMFKIRENQWLLHRDGQLDTATWKAYATGFVGLLARDPLFRATWRSSVVVLDPGFVRDVELQLPAESQPQPAKKEGAPAAP
jgi:hypothetical protein